MKPYSTTSSLQHIFYTPLALAGKLESMPQPARQHESRTQGIVIPSRSDPLLAELTEVVGGPLGRRAAPGKVDPGFFTVERVLVLITFVAAVLAVVAKQHCRTAGWSTPDQYSTVCWSQFPNALSSVRFPAVLSGLKSPLAYFDAHAALLAVAWLVLVLVVARSNPRRPWDAAFVAASPLLVLCAYVSWDLFGAALVGLGLLLVGRRRIGWAGAVLGVAGGVAPYALLVLAVVLVLHLRTRLYSAAAKCGAAAVVGFLLIAVSVARIAPGVPGGRLGAFFATAPSPSSPYGSYNLIAGRLGIPPLPTAVSISVSLLLLAAVVVGVVLLGLRVRRRPRLAQLATVAVGALTLIDPQAQPWHCVWLLPLVALAYPRWRAVLLWQAAGIVHFVALMLFLSKTLGGINYLHAIDMPYFVLAALGNAMATLVVMALVLRDILDPSGDVVRRGGIEDPLGTVFDRPSTVADGDG